MPVSLDPSVSCQQLYFGETAVFHPRSSLAVEQHSSCNRPLTASIGEDAKCKQIAGDSYTVLITEYQSPHCALPALTLSNKASLPSFMRGAHAYISGRPERTFEVSSHVSE
jgi:hypothetical protein